MVNTPPYRSSFAPVPTDECRYTRPCAPVPVYTTTSGRRHLYDRTSHASQQFRAATGSTATDGSQTRAGSLSLLTTWARSDRKLGAPRLPQGHRPRPLRFCYSTASTVQESLDIQNSERRDREVDRSRGPEVKKSRDPQIGREVERQTEVQRIETTPEIHGSEERSRGREVQRSRGPQVQRSRDPEIRGEVHR